MFKLPSIRSTTLVLGALAAPMVLAWTAPAATAQPAAAIEIRTEDVERFYDLYDRSDGHPTVEQIQRLYVEPGSEGLRHLMQVRRVSAERIATALADRPELYANARDCLAVLPRVRERLRLTFDNLLRLYPEASRPPITILVSRGRPVAIAGPGTGVQVALEALCSDIAVRFLGADVDDRFVNLIAHEYIHVQQAPEQGEPTVLERALQEGIAEYLGELISGGIANVGVHRSVEGREREIEERFAADLDKTDLSDWFDNTTEEEVGQLGYWVGYRIAKAYHAHAADRRAAIGEMIRMTDAHAFLARSGWRPGIVLPETNRLAHGGQDE